MSASVSEMLANCLTYRNIMIGFRSAPWLAAAAAPQMDVKINTENT